ncbi:MAG: YigZ family protein [Candidatus Delongbacteria bacterium]|nr:YigZ family protein [Candidatus Delongbacteria bacterium]
MTLSKECFYTVPENSEFEIDKIKGSRFIGRIFRVDSKEKAEEIITLNKKKFYDATHNCFAYKIGVGDRSLTRFSDDGEPSGTAGKPILSVIEGENITNTLVIVTRYYGGTKLGTGGLIKAYTLSAKEAIQNIEKICVEIRSDIVFDFDYDMTSLVMNMISAYEGKIMDEVYADNVSIVVNINNSFIMKFKNEIFEKSLGKILVSV